MSTFGIIILAAGNSSRMGQPKQLLNINKQSLIRKTVLTALASNIGPVYLVLGFEIEKIQAEVADLNINIVHNPDWKKGMASSLRAGVNEILQTNPAIQSVLVLLCDQVLVSATYLKKLSAGFEKSAQPAIASQYGNVKGVPAIFDIRLLAGLQSTGDFGARHLIHRLDQQSSLSLLPFPEGAIDLDTMEDFENFMKSMDS